jgi:hypothetical protein
MEYEREKIEWLTLISQGERRDIYSLMKKTRWLEKFM